MSWAKELVKERPGTPESGSDQHILGLDECASFDNHNDQYRNWKENLSLANRNCFQYVQLSESDGMACSSKVEER